MKSREPKQASAEWLELGTLDGTPENVVRPAPSCGRCAGPLGKSWWQGVPGEGDLCAACHDGWMAEQKAST